MVLPYMDTDHECLYILPHYDNFTLSADSCVGSVASTAIWLILPYKALQQLYIIIATCSHYYHRFSHNTVDSQYTHAQLTMWSLANSIIIVWHNCMDCFLRHAKKKKQSSNPRLIQLHKYKINISI